MGGHSCSTDGDLNGSKFSEPLPWIGCYVAAASLACCVAMAADAVLGFRHRTLWFPCKFFSLNATSLTLIAAAVKLSVDLNTTMPRREDQLTKLSSAVLICTVMGNSMPSLGAMESTTDIAMNMMALGILVVTLVVNICIQLGTGAIYVFRAEHVCTVFLLLVLLMIMSFSAVSVPTTKRFLEMKYRKQSRLAMEECFVGRTHEFVFGKLREDMMKYWMMAHSSSPQFVMGRSVTCASSGALCVLGSLLLVEAMVRSYSMPWSINFCSGKSDYKWSIVWVLIIQAAAVAAGTIAPAFRWFTAVSFICRDAPNQRSFRRSIFRVENYWIQVLIELKERPWVLRIPNRRIRKLAHGFGNLLLDLCIKLQTAIVGGSKAVRLASVVFLTTLLACRGCLQKLGPNLSLRDGESGAARGPDLSRFVLHLEGEEGLVQVIMENNCDATEHWIQRGRRRPPTHLLQLLRDYASCSQGFRGIRDFDSDEVPSLYPLEPPRCWALPVVTLATIAAALPNIDSRSRGRLIRGVSEGLMFVRFIEEHLDAEAGAVMKNLRRAADVVWLGVDLRRRWLDVDLPLAAKSASEVLERLSCTAEQRCREFQGRIPADWAKESLPKWPKRVVAANSMYRACRTLLVKRGGEGGCGGSERWWRGLCVMIRGVMCACLTNLRGAIVRECACSGIEEREARVRRAVFLVGRAEGILQILQEEALPSPDHDQLARIDDWHLSVNTMASAFHGPSPV